MNPRKKTLETRLFGVRNLLETTKAIVFKGLNVVGSIVGPNSCEIAPSLLLEK